MLERLTNARVVKWLGYAIAVLVLVSDIAHEGADFLAHLQNLFGG